MARRLLGSATTDSNGVATLNYTGQGVGKMQIVAEIIVQSGTCTSETIEIGDWLFYDGGVIGDNSTDWTYYNGSVITETVTETGTVLDIPKSSVTSGLKRSTVALTGDFEAIVYSESDNTSGASRTRFGLTDGSTRQYVQKGGNVWLKLVRENDVTTAFSSTDGENWSSETVNGSVASGSSLYITIGLYNTSYDTQTILYKDLKVNSI